MVLLLLLPLMVDGGDGCGTDLFMRCVAVSLSPLPMQTTKAFYNVARLLVDISRLIYQFMIWIDSLESLNIFRNSISHFYLDDMRYSIWICFDAVRWKVNNLLARLPGRQLASSSPFTYNHKTTGTQKCYGDLFYSGVLVFERDSFFSHFNGAARLMCI